MQDDRPNHPDDGKPGEPRHVSRGCVGSEEHEPTDQIARADVLPAAGRAAYGLLPSGTGRWA